MKKKRKRGRRNDDEKGRKKSRIKGGNFVCFKNYAFWNLIFRKLYVFRVNGKGKNDTTCTL